MSYRTNARPEDLEALAEGSRTAATRFEARVRLVVMCLFAAASLVWCAMQLWLDGASELRSVIAIPVLGAIHVAFAYYDLRRR